MSDRERAIAFWSEFDDRFQYRQTEQVRRWMGDIWGGERAWSEWVWFRKRDDPAGFREAMQPYAAALGGLARLQGEVMEGHFDGDADALRGAFEAFGQGVLHNPSRPPGDRVHKMDTGGPASPPTHYHRWYATIRASVLCGVADEARWLAIARLVGLAWAIQSRARPREDRPDNPEWTEADLQPFRDLWLPLPWEALDEAFDSEPYPPPSLLPGTP